MKRAADHSLCLKLMAFLLEIKRNMFSMIYSYWNCRKGDLFYLQQEDQYGEQKWDHRFSNRFTEAKILEESWYFDTWLTVSLTAFLLEFEENLFSMISVYWNCLQFIKKRVNLVYKFAADLKYSSPYLNPHRSLYDDAMMLTTLNIRSKGVYLSYLVREILEIKVESLLS